MYKFELHAVRMNFKAAFSYKSFWYTDILTIFFRNLCESTLQSN